MRSKCPTVSVLLATHNGSAYLKQALDSMASQTFSDWEWVLVDDGSTDDTPMLLSTYAKQFGDRVRIVRNDVNMGLTASLNRGLEEIRGRYVARMDDDDIAHPERLARQVAALAADDRLLLVGTSGLRMNHDTGESRSYMPAYDSLRLRMCLCWFNPFMHASVMFRSRLPDGNVVRYDERYVTAQDYALWASLSLLGRVAVLPQSLMTHRERRGGVTDTRRKLQVESTKCIRKWYTDRMTWGTTLEGCRPEDIWSWIDDPGVPDRQRLQNVKTFFEIVARPSFIYSGEHRHALMNWAAPRLDSLAWTHLIGDNSRALWLSAGVFEAMRYVIKRWFKDDAE